jgi:hypothetical protein
MLNPEFAIANRKGCVLDFGVVSVGSERMKVSMDGFESWMERRCGPQQRVFRDLNGPVRPVAMDAATEKFGNNRIFWN